MARSLLNPQTPAKGARRPDQIGPLGRLAGWSFHHRGRVLLLWLLALVAALGASTAFSGAYNADYSAPRSDSKIAQELLAKHFPEASGDLISVVVRAPAGATDPAVKTQVEAMLGRMAKVSHVKSVDDPYLVPGSISADGHTAIGRLRLDVTNPVDMPKTDTHRLLDIAGEKHDGMEVFLGGSAVQFAEQNVIGSEGIGMAAAAIILLLTFGSVVAAGLPILTALAGLAVSSLLIPVVAAMTQVPDWSTALASMMGIGVGIDYVLLLVTRFREWRAEGLDPATATIATLDTAGRSVVVAGLTVVTSMLGLFAMGLAFMRGAALAAILAVLVVLAASVTLLPAILGYLGRHVDRLRIPLPGTKRTPSAVGPSRRWLVWSRFVERHRVIAAVGGVAILLALAVPFLSVRFGLPDGGNDPEGRSNRQAYDTVSASFGPGTNGPLVLVATLPVAGETKDLDALAGRLRQTPGVAAVAPVRLNAAGDAAILTVIPTTGPQDHATEELVHTLRDEIVPQTVSAGTDVHVGGLAALAIDISENIQKRLPLLIGGVVIVSMLLLLLAFRSIAVALKAAAMNLLSVAAAYGVVALVLRGGPVGQLIGIDTPTPLPAFVPVLMFAVLFGLSMDYEVFLVSRMRETWLRTHDNRESIVNGLASTARVITAAAAIMVAVFAAFVPSPEVPIKVIGVGMASAILIDATLVRMLLVPAVMHLMGASNWWLPRWLDRLLPHLHIEGHPETYQPERAPAPKLTKNQKRNNKKNTKRNAKKQKRKLATR